jgi:MoxR-like ATPase
MEEHQVSVDGETRPLPAPFFVIATQNPLFHSGTNALPESQLDRFLIRLSLGFPDRNAELQLLQQDASASQHRIVPALLSTERLIALQQQIPRQQISDEVLGYVLDLIGHSRKRSDMLPLSPRAAKGLVRAGKAYAFLQQRSFVTADDIQAVFPAVAEHRLQPRQQQQYAGLAQQLLLETPCLV